MLKASTISLRLGRGNADECTAISRHSRSVVALNRDQKSRARRCAPDPSRWRWSARRRGGRSPVCNCGRGDDQGDVRSRFRIYPGFRQHNRLNVKVVLLFSGSEDRRLPTARSHVGSARGSHPPRTTDQLCGHRLMRVKPRAPTGCWHGCRRKEPLPSGQRSGSLIARVQMRFLRAGRDNFRDNLALQQRSRHSKRVVYLGFSPR